MDISRSALKPPLYRAPALLRQRASQTLTLVFASNVAAIRRVADAEDKIHRILAMLERAREEHAEAQREATEAERDLLEAARVYANVHDRTAMEMVLDAFEGEAAA